MGLNPTALYTHLLGDVKGQISEAAYNSIVGGYFLWPGMTRKEAAVASIVRSCLKKLKPDSSEILDARASEKFLQCNEACRTWVVPEPVSSYQDELLGEFRRALYKFWYKDGTNAIFDHDYDALYYGRCGPGSAIDSRGGDWYVKLYDSSLTHTKPYLYELYKRYIKSFPEWSNAESIRHGNHGEASVVEGNRLSFVPKNCDISRTICVEPTLNMFYQLGFGHVLERRLEECFGINLANQQLKNRELARQGSIFDNYVTIDLSSASDSISLSMLKWCLPPSWYSWLVKYRSERCKIGASYHDLHMVSTMGNGFTFPLQTILFSCVVIAAMKVHDRKILYPRGVDYGNFGVNGDDIICERECSTSVMWLLNTLGFVINRDKTFIEGPFRESCGADFFQGVNIRGVYVKQLDTQQDAYAVINQLNLFSTRTGIILKGSVKYLLARVRKDFVPRYDNDDSGIKVPQSMLRIVSDKDCQALVLLCLAASCG